MWEQKFSCPTISTKPAFSMACIGCSFTCENTTFTPWRSQRFTICSSASTPVASIAGTLRIRMQRTSMSQSWSMYLYLSAAAKNMGPLIS